MAPAKSCLHAAELINFNKGGAIIAQNVGSSSNASAKQEHLDSNDPTLASTRLEGCTQFFVLLFLSKGADFNDFKFCDVMNNTFTISNELVFPFNDKSI